MKKSPLACRKQDQVVRNWSLIPKVSYTNFRYSHAFKKPFQITRGWGGQIINVYFFHHQLAFDFRGLPDFANARDDRP